MPRIGPNLLLATAILAAAQAPARPVTSEVFEAIRAADLRIQTIGEQLATANVRLCDARQAVIGLVPVALSAFAPEQRAAAALAFGLNGALGVEAVVPGGPADRAGLRAGDELTAIGDWPVPPIGTAAAPSTHDLSILADLIARMRPEASNTIAFRRGATLASTTVVPNAGCRARFELELTGSHVADSDGAVIRIGAPFVDALDDDQLAAVLAHELGHGILRHPARLDAARIDRGLLSAFGRNAREIRRTEDEADRLSIVLLQNAGYDPAAASRFWRAYGAKIAGGPLRSPTHASPATRAALLDAAVAALPPRAGFLCPATVLACRLHAVTPTSPPSP